MMKRFRLAGIQAFRCILRVFGVWVIAASGTAHVCAGTVTVSETYCEYAVNPLGLDTSAPRLSWVLDSDQRDRRQIAYRILVSNTQESLAADTGDKWDSGKVASDRSVNVVDAGASLTSGERCFWKVRCWDNDDEPSDWSAPASFEIGLLNESEWQAQWIDNASSVDYVPGKWGQALQLNGNGETVRIPHDASLKPAQQVTLAAWIRPGDELGDAWREIYRKEDGSARHLLALGRTGSITGLWVGLGIGGSYVEFGAPTSLEALKDGAWHHVAATYDGTTIRLYVDGVPIGSQARTGALNTGGTAPSYIGSNRGVDEFFPGGIDDVRFYRRSLSPTEMAALFATGGQSDPDLVGWWKLDGNLVNTVSDVPGEFVGGVHGAPLLRKEIDIAKPVERARVYMSGVGWSELYIDGVKIGDHVLDPAATDYDKRILYVVHDVTALLSPGPHALGVMLGNGWFSEPPTPGYGNAPRLRIQMHVHFTDGTDATFLSDATWKVTEGPIVRNDIFGGETYDARLDKAGWRQPGYDDSDWSFAHIAPPPGGVMQPQPLPPIKVVESLAPIELINPAPGIYVYNFGQLFGGWSRLRVNGPAGTKITLKYSPRVFTDSGLVDKRRHPEPKETDYYILKGDPEGEQYEPRFTYHPVQYVQIEGYPGVPTLDDLKGCVVHTAIDLSGDFECSNELFNKIHRNAVWTLRNELYGFPLDCLHREHWGWLEPGTNPSTAFARKHMPLFWHKFLNDAKYAQHADGVIPDVVPAYPLKGRTTGDPAWAGNYPLMVWYVFQYYDDRRILEEHYASMKAWLDHLIAISANNLITSGYYGDHMLPGPAPGQEEFISSETPPPLLWSGFFYRNAVIVSNAAQLLGHAADALQYRQLSRDILSAINAEWFDESAGSYATGSQTSNLMPLVLGIVPEGREPDVVASIVEEINNHDQHFHTGNLGTSSLMEVSLATHGQGRLMYEVMNQTSYPGYGYMVDQGATTLWEAWGLRDDLGSGEESMDMWGSVDEFFYGDLAGIRGPAYFGPDTMTPGFREIDIRPHVLGDLTYARAHIRTVRGMVSSDWWLIGDTFRLDVDIPVNSTGRISVPTFGAAQVTIREGDHVVWSEGQFQPAAPGITGATRESDRVTFTVGSGSYTFTVPVPLARRADLDRDGDVDEADVALFLACLTGTRTGPPSQLCETADLDVDSDVDQSDYGFLQRCISGAGMSPGPACRG